MAKFSKISQKRLLECDQRLVDLFTEVIADFDCVVLVGHRNKVDQDAAVAAGNSKLVYPKSKHNTVPSKAIDVGPYDRPQSPIDWNDRERFTLFAGFVLGVAKSRGIPLRWGGDWNGDNRLADNTFDDLVHFELID